MRWLLASAAALAALAAGPATATATWQNLAAPGGAAAKAATLPTGATPAVSVSGRNVAVSWSASSISGQPVDGYAVKRYDAEGAEQTAGAGCSGTVTATACTESAVPPGSWTYRVTPRHGNWIGGASAPSPTATVAAAALSLSPATVSSLPATLSGTLSGFVGGSTVTYRLDDPATGTVLSGSTSPSPISSGGGASVSVTLPSGTANGAHTVYAVGSDGTVAGASITVSASTCPTSAAPLTWLTGMEHGSVTTGGTVGAWSAGVGTATADTAVKRNGLYSLKLAPSNAAAYRTRNYAQAGNAVVARFALRLASLPAANTDLASWVDSGHLTSSNYLAFRYNASTQRFSIGFPGQTVLSSQQVEAGRWYVVDVRFDPRSDPHTADWRIDGVSQTSTSNASAAGHVINSYFGSSLASTFTANYDDIAISETPSAYPLGDGKVLALKTDGMGTSVGAANFQNDDSTAINSTSWNRLDEIPLGSTTDGIKQTVTSGTSYVELTFQDTTETCVRAVGGRLAYDQLSTNQSNHAKTTVVDASTERTVYDGVTTGSSAVLVHKYATIAPAAAAWTADTVNALRARVGYSADASPVPAWSALLLEYDAPL